LAMMKPETFGAFLVVVVVLLVLLVWFGVI
jgi:hypothetical protein